MKWELASDSLLQRDVFLVWLQQRHDADFLCASGQFGWAVICLLHSVTCRWTTGEWGPCSATCGGGTQTRSVYCVAFDGQSSQGVVDNAECMAFAQQPRSSQPCNMRQCATWSTGPWSEVSLCGGGDCHLAPIGGGSAKAWGKEAGIFAGTVKGVCLWIGNGQRYKICPCYPQNKFSGLLAALPSYKFVHVPQSCSWPCTLVPLITWSLSLPVSQSFPHFCYFIRSTRPCWVSEPGLVKVEGRHESCSPSADDVQ